MDRKIKRLAKQADKLRRMVEQDARVLSVSITFDRDFKNKVAKIHIYDPIPGMSDGEDFPGGLLKRKIDVFGVEVFSLQEKEEEHGL